MTLRYQVRHGCQVPDYMCQGEGIQHGGPACQHIPGAAIDQAIGELLISAMTPLAPRAALGGHCCGQGEDRGAGQGRSGGRLCGEARRPG
jgi:hypothetical protein